MKKIKIYIFLGLAAMLLSSCVGVKTYNSVWTTSFAPNQVRLDLTLNDFVFVGKETVTVSYNTYFGFIKVIDEINGKEADMRNINYVKTYGTSWMPVEEYVDRALYDVKLKMPEAEIFMPVDNVVEIQEMFLGRKIKRTYTVIGYKIKR